MKIFTYFILSLGIGLALSGCDANKLAQIGNIPSTESGQIPTTPANLSLSSTNYNYGMQSVNSINNAVITVTNSGTEAATNVATSGLASAFTFEGGSYPGQGGTCTNTISNSCTIVVSFIPTDVVSYTGQFNLSYTGGGKTQNVQVALSGSGTNIASLRISLDGKTEDTNPFDFGQLASGTSVTQTFTVIYAGALPATGIAYSGIAAPFVLSNNTCGAVVTANCSFQITYTANGSTSQQMVLTYNNSAYADQSSLQMSGEMIPVTFPAVLTINGGQPITFTEELINPASPETLTITVANASNASFAATNITLAPFSSGTVSLTGGTCKATAPFTLAANGSCTLILAFDPTTAKTYSDNLTLAYGNGVSATPVMATEAISGIGGNAALLVPSLLSYSFPSQSVNFSTNSTSITLTNNSTLNVNATSIAFAVSAPFSITSNGCTGVVAGGKSCSFAVAFKPTAVASYSTTLTVSYSYVDAPAPATPLQIMLSGMGLATAKLTVNSYTFPNTVVGINPSPTATVTFSYYGTDPASLVFPLGGGISAPFSQVSTTCGPSITANCTVTFSFAPTAAQTYKDVLSIAYIDTVTMASMTPLPFTLQGTGVNPAILAFTDGATYSYGQVTIGGTAGSHSFTLSNSGTASATNVSYSSLSSPFAKVSTTCTTTVATNCSYVISFAPTTVTVPNQTFTVSYNDGSVPAPTQNKSISITLSGSGLALAILNASVGAFNSNNNKVAVGGTGQATITVSNSGSLAASGIAVTAPTAPFSIASGGNGCAATLAPLASCAITVTFNPTAPGVFSSSVAIAYMNTPTTAGAPVSAGLTAMGTVPIQLSVSGDHSCIKTDIDTVECWGDNNQGQLGLGNTTPAIGVTTGQMGANLQVANLGSSYTYGAVKVVSGYWHTCVLLNDGNIKCFGANFAGQLGVGDTANRGETSSTMGDDLAVVNLGTGRTAKDITAGYAHTCALLDDNNVKCWGLNATGQLGQGNTTNIGIEPTDMENLSEIDLGGTAVTAISAGTGDTCAVLQGGILKCWGDNFYGQLGLGDSKNRGDMPNEMGTSLPAVNMGTGRTVVKVSSGGGYHCAILDNGGVKCMGRNDSEGNLGVPLWCQDAAANAGPCGGNYTFALLGYGVTPGQTGDNNPYVNLGSGLTATDIESGEDFNCVILSDKGVKCWGANDYGELGHGNTTAEGAGVNDMGSNLIETPISSTTTASTITLGSTFACSVLGDGTIKCWGDDRAGELGQGNTDAIGVTQGQILAETPVNWGPN